jgi:DNA/RNA endonuclease G (NUC1)
MIGTKILALALLLGLVAAPATAAETFEQMHAAATNNAQDCAQHFRGIGLPRYAANRDAIIVCHKRFLLSHNNKTRSPDWVIERLDNSTLKRDGFPRPVKGFVQDKHVPERARANDDDYEGNAYGFTRGHMAPSEDFNNDREEMKASFILSNAVPQVGSAFNSSIWGQLEGEVRSAVLRGQEFRELYVITGPVQRFRGTRSRTIGSSRSCGGELPLTGPPEKRLCKSNNTRPNPNCGTAGVAIPIAIFKIVYDPQSGAAHAFVLANKNHDPHTGSAEHPYLEKHRVTVGAIERITGIRLFRELSADKQRVANRCAATPLWGP